MTENIPIDCARIINERKKNSFKPFQARNGCQKLLVRDNSLFMSFGLFPRGEKAPYRFLYHETDK